MNKPEQAAEWFTRLRETELSSAEHKQLAAWLAESPANMLNYLRTAEIWGALQSANIWPAESKEELYQAIRQANGVNIVRLRKEFGVTEVTSEQDSTQGRARKRRWPLYGALAATVAAVALFVGTQLNGNSATYKTARGEQRSIVLPDGSIVQLNTLSTLVIDFDNQNRRVKLPRGEAFFRVAHDKARPFDVETPFATVHAVGTEFDVYNRKDATHVLVVEGKVGITPNALGEKKRSLPTKEGRVVREFLTAGQQITVSAASLPKPTRAKVAAATAWMQRRIVLDRDRIDTAVDEFNRYNTKQIQIRDPALGDIRITGAFNADDPGALVKYIQEIRDVRVIETDGQLILQ